MSRGSRGGGLGIFEGVGGSGRYRRRGSSALLKVVTVLVVAALAAAAAWVLYRRINPDTSVQLQVLGVDGPVAGAIIESPNDSATTDAEGIAHLPLEPPVPLVVSAPGYHTGTFEVEAVPVEGSLGLQLDPVVLKGRVTDSGGNGIAGALVSIGSRRATTNEQGSFEFVAAAPGTVGVSKAAWEPAVAEWDGSEGRFQITMEPFIVRGLRVNGNAAGTPARFQAILEMAEGSVVNTLVFDTKEESGAVLYDSQVPDARSTGAVVDVYDVEEVIAAAKERGLYTITRIVTFQDNYWAPANSEHATRLAGTGELWRNNRGLAWMDPTDREAWEYPIALAVEACRLGFDEIQFDYVRFPSDGNVSTAEYDLEVEAQVRVETITAYLEEARSRIHAEGCAVSADVFAIVLSVNDDQGLGQRVEEFSHVVDAISPMIYPSHYSPGWLGFNDPNDHPSEVVDEALTSGLPRIEGDALMRPWLQAFYYDAAQIAQEIDQAESRGLGWILWNALSEFQAGWLPRD